MKYSYKITIKTKKSRYCGEVIQLPANDVFDDADTRDWFLAEHVRNVEEAGGVVVSSLLVEIED